MPDGVTAQSLFADVALRAGEVVSAGFGVAVIGLLSERDSGFRSTRQAPAAIIAATTTVPLCTVSFLVGCQRDSANAIPMPAELHRKL